MAKYMIELPHTQEECLKTMDEIVSEKRAVLAKFDFGCRAGNHAGWAKVEAGSEKAALNMLPAALRKNACATRITKITPAQIRAWHEM